MKTSYAVGDRCRVAGAEGTIKAVVPERNGYRVQMDDGRSVSVDEKHLQGPAPARPTHKMVEGPRRRGRAGDEG
jgi:hypothetical protein